MRITAQNRQPLLYIHYDGWSRKYDEYLYIDSSRVAPLGFYSNRTDIPRYRMCQHQPNAMYANVVDSGRQAMAQLAPADENGSSDEDNAANDAAEDNAQNDDAALAEEQIRQMEDSGSVV